MKSLFRNCYFVFIVLKHSYCYSGGFVVAYGVRQLNRVNIVERITVGSFWFCLGFFVGFIIVIVTVILFWALEKWLVVNFFSGLKRQTLGLSTRSLKTIHDWFVIDALLLLRHEVINFFNLSSTDRKSVV